MPKVTLLGPQRLAPNLATIFHGAGIEGPVASITAGWQEREGEDEELASHLDRPVVDLRLHRRAEEVFDRDPELFRAYRARQKELRELHELYRYRLDFVLEPASELLRRSGASPALEMERDAALDALRRLDHEHLRRMRAVHRTFTRRWHPLRRPAVAAHRRRLRALLADAAAVTIAGGHVAVLLNRMRLFGLDRLLGERPVFAWSAGAMVLAERIVLFHDHPPQGAGNAEVLESGLGLLRGIIPLPHARRRLRLRDPHRIALFARRFVPDVCIPLDEGSHIAWDRPTRQWIPGAGLLTLQRDGRLGRFESP